MSRRRSWLLARPTWTLRYAVETYINVLVEQDDARVPESYGPKFDRLQWIKAKYDPDNVFRHNANIKPAERVPAS